MNPDDLAKILDELGKRLGPAGQHVFELAVRQAVVGSAMQIVALSLVLAGMFLGVAGSVYAYRHSDSDDDRGFFVVITGVFIVACALVVAIALFGPVTTLLNPEYAAIRDILSQVKR